MSSHPRVSSRIGARIIPLLLVLLLFTPIATGCRLFPKEEVEDIPALVQPPEEELVTHLLVEGPIAEELTAYARVGSAREQQVYFPVSGRVREVLIHLGDMVKKGQTLVALETGELSFYLREAQVNLEQEQLRCEQQFGADSEAARTLRLAELDVQRAQLELEQALSRLQAKDPARTEQEQEELENAAERARLGLEQAKLNHKRRQDANSLARRIAQLNLERARLEYGRLSQQLENSVIQAPFAGKVIALSAVRGHSVEAFAPMAIIADMKGLEMIANVTTKDANRLRPGMEVRVRLDRGPPRTGRITVIEQSEGAQPGSDEWIARIRMDDPRFPLKLDDFYTISFVLRFAPRALLVPNDALREDVSGRRYIRTIEGKRRRDAYVKIGIEGETHSQILEGAEAGMTVIGK